MGAQISCHVYDATCPFHYRYIIDSDAKGVGVAVNFALQNVINCSTKSIHNYTSACCILSFYGSIYSLMSIFFLQNEQYCQ